MSLIINGQDIRDLGLILLKDHDNPATSSTRDYFVTIPGKHGAYDFGGDLDVKQLNLPIGIKEQNSPNELALLIRNIVPIFIDSYGRSKTIKVKFSYEPDVFYNARYSGSLPIERLFRMGRFNLPLVVVDSSKKFVESTEDIIWDSDTPFMSDVPLDAKYSYDITTSQIMAIHNFGTMVVRPKIEIIGTATNLTLTLNDGKSFSFGNLSNETLIIDANNFTVLKNNSNFLYGMSGSDISELELMVGRNDIGVDGQNLNLTFTVKFYAQYL